MKTLLSNIYNAFINFFGDIKVFKFPLFIVYDPGSYKVKGGDIRDVLKLIAPGDILVRGYINYLDGYFIPGFFSHAGLYLGPIDESLKAGLEPRQHPFFQAGEQIVIHSMAEGVFMEDVINFCRCDFMLILRRKPGAESEASKNVTFADVQRQALKDLGKEYDFRFDFLESAKLSCTELVYDCCQGFLNDYGIKVRTKKVMFMTKKLITPDDFVNSGLDVVWKSNSVTDKKLASIRNKS